MENAYYFLLGHNPGDFVFYCRKQYWRPLPVSCYGNFGSQEHVEDHRLGIFVHFLNFWLRRAISGTCGTDTFVTLRSKWKNLFQKLSICGQYHQMWNREPKWSQLLKHIGDTSGYILARIEGTLYQRVRILTLASMKYSGCLWMSIGRIGTICPGSILPPDPVRRVWRKEV